MFFRTAAANLRNIEDSLNPAIGGVVAGALLGTKVRTLPGVVGCGVGLGVVMGVFEFTGGALGRWGSGGDGKGGWKGRELERKEGVRAQGRRDGRESIRELGEGRGINSSFSVSWDLMGG